MDVRLVMFKVNGQRRDFPILHETTVIGRAAKCDLRIPLLSVSRRHCEISIDGQQVQVRDLASSNGTYLNNRRVNEHALKAGDRLVVGPIVFTVQVDGQPEEIKPVKTKAQKLAEAQQTNVQEAINLDEELEAKLSDSQIRTLSAETADGEILQADDADDLAAN